MALFWKRKNKERFVTLGLNEPALKRSDEQTQSAPDASTAKLERPAALSQTNGAPVEPSAPVLEHSITGDAPTPFLFI